MNDQLNSLGSQLPQVVATSQTVPATSAMPVTDLNPAVSTPQGIAVQQALSVLMNTSLSPYQMALQFAAIKEGYLAKTYGITVG